MVRLVKLNLLANCIQRHKKSNPDTNTCISEKLFLGGLEPGTAGWKAQTNPLCYGGTL